MKSQKELKELYRENLKLAWNDPHMVDFCSKQADQVVETEDGYLLEVERQNIETHFCFGYGYCGISDDESENRAFDNCDYARTNEKYFIKENLKYFDKNIKDLEENDCYVSLNGKYYSQSKDCKLQNYRCYGHNTPDNDYKKLSDTDKQNLIDAFKAGRENMIKRLNTYLKKYGLTKLDCWTYLRD